MIHLLREATYLMTGLFFFGLIGSAIVILVGIIGDIRDLVGE